MKELKFKGCKDPSYGYLSNFYFAKFKVDGFIYKTVEHFYQSKKFVKKEHQKQVLQCSLASDARRLGKQLPMREIFDVIKDYVMYQGVYEKFKQNPLLAQKLKYTETSHIIENSPWDNYWGSGKTGKGLNKLGQILMLVRSRLVCEDINKN